MTFPTFHTSIWSWDGGEERSGNQASFITEGLAYATSQAFLFFYSWVFSLSRFLWWFCYFFHAKCWHDGLSIPQPFWCVFQAQGTLQEYLLAMTTDEQLLNHTTVVSLQCLVNIDAHLNLKHCIQQGSLRPSLMFSVVSRCGVDDSSTKKMFVHLPVLCNSLS